MEDNRYVKETKKFVKVAVTIILMWPLVLNAYSEKTTHPALTDETVDFFNLNYPSRVLSDSEKSLIKTGSTEEDENPRYLMHFYDPVYNRGLIYLGKEWMSSKDWAEDTKAQARWDYLAMGLGATREYFSVETDYTWERAIYDYVWDDKNRGLKALGHILHLIQDASVPDHTRNDAHPPIFDWGSPYEAWTSRFDDKNIDTLSKIKTDKPVILSELKSYFDSMAKYSNNNFFSKDTILFAEYKDPSVSNYKTELLSNDIKYTFAYSSNGHRLFRFDKEVSWYSIIESDSEANKYLQDNDDLVLTDYWSRLSKQAVLHGAGVVKLFFDEVEKEKQTKYLYYKNRNWFEKAWDWVSGWFGSSDPSTSSGQASDVLIASVYDPAVQDEVLAAFEEGDPDQPVIIGAVPNPEDSAPSLPSTSDVFSSSLDSFRDSSSTSDVTPDGEVRGVSTSGVGPDGRDSFGLYPITILGGGGPSNSSGQGGSAVTSTSDDFPPSGTTSDVTTTDEEPAPSAPDEETATTTPPAPPDTTPPNLELGVAECGDSFSEDGCLTTSTTLNFSWSSSAGDLKEYSLSCESGGAVCADFPMIFASTSTSTIQTFETDNVYSFTLEAKDTSGNATLKDLKIEISRQPVVINEIAWMGTAGHPEDEFIELYNPTTKEISFGDGSWKLFSATDNSPDITLTGAIAAHGYYLIERKNTDETDEPTQSSVKDISADMWVGFSRGLNNSGEHLKLVRASTTIDEVERWYAGNSGSDSRTMERFRENRPGTDSDNWGRNNNVIKNGVNVDDVEIRGTPKAKNSVSYQLTTKSYLDNDLTIAKARSPYLIPDEYFTIQTGVTIEIESGVVIKFSDGDGGRIYVEGVLKALGTADEPVIFTSFYDDEYGDDLNDNSTSTVAVPGSIRGLWFKPTSSGSELDHVLVRYGGRYFHGNPMLGRAILGVEEADVVISNSTFENSYSNGVVFEGASSGARFENNIVRGHADIGMRVEGGAPVLTRNVFEANDYGLWVMEAPGAKITSNIFRNNSEYAIRNWGEIAEYSGNSGSGNTLGGIGISDDFLPAGVTILKKNDIPYIIDTRAIVSDGEELTFESGVVFKGRASNFPPGILIVEDGGRMFYSGATSSEIIFTSIYDDSVAGDSDNSTTTPMAGNWTGIEVAAGGELDMSGFTIRYAGGEKISQGDARAGLRITGGTATTTNALISTNKQFGIRVLDGGSLYIKNSEISNHDEEEPRKGVGLEVNESSAVIENITLSNNDIDIQARGAYSITCNGPCGYSSSDPDPL